MNQNIGQVFATDANFTIYSMGNESTGLYFACVPNNLKDTLKVFVDLHKKGDFNLYREIRNDLKREDLVVKLKDVNKFINGMNHSGVYVMPFIDIAAVENLNDQAKGEEFNRVFKMIAGCTKDVSEKLNNFSNGQRTIEQAITIIEQTESDKHFVAWLKQQFPNFVLGITLDDLRKQYQVENQIVNQNVAFENVNMNVIDNNVISNSSSVVSSNVNISNDNIMDMAKANVENGVSIESGINNVNDQVASQSFQTVVDQPQQVQPGLGQNVVNNATEPVSRAPIVHIESSGIAPIDRSYDEAFYQQEQSKGHTLTKKPNNKMGSVARAGFVKFPVFVLTLMAIGALGIFVGKMFYAYLSQ